MDFLTVLKDALSGLIMESGFIMFLEGDNYKYLIMIGVALFFIYLAIVKKYEPFLLLPIAFGMILTNLPGANMYHSALSRCKLHKGAKLGYTGNFSLVNVANNDVHLKDDPPKAYLLDVSTKTCSPEYPYPNLSRAREAI